MTLIFLTDNNFSKCDFSFWIFIPGILPIIKLVSLSNKPVGHTYKLTYLNFIRTFIRRFYALFATLKQRKSYYLIRVTSDVKEDTLVILEFLDNFNGEYYMPIWPTIKCQHNWNEL
jgi:hypothetical protein